MKNDSAVIAERPPRAEQGFADFDIVLEPVSHPDLGDIRIEDNLFAIGRTEPPFVTYPQDKVADLSRRHARIFCEYGVVYIADLDSKNGTTVNGVNIQQKISRLHDGDEICFGRSLTYRVKLGTRERAPRHTDRLVSMTLTPEKADTGIQPIVITQLPFLVSKSDDVFGRYKNDFPHQVEYLSRRHAHIFMRGGSPCVEDLGSTNGTFVNGKRLEEHAVCLADGDVLAFGGHHFVYTVSLQKDTTAIDPTVTKISDPPPKVMPAVPDAMDKTTFIAAPDSFLEIFCIEPAGQTEEEPVNEEKKEADGAARESRKPRARGKFSSMVRGAAQALHDGERTTGRRGRWWAAIAFVLLTVAGGWAYFHTGTERQLQDMVAQGDHEQAALLASRVLESDPGNGGLQALGTEALLKAHVPGWLKVLQAGDFAQAAAIHATMTQLGGSNKDVQPLLAELEWMGKLSEFAATRKQADAPIRIFADEERIKQLLAYWDEDTSGHQRSLARIVTHVPEFREPYATALSHLRRLQSENAVYLAAIDRLKSTIDTELGRDRPEALTVVFNDYAEKYPRIGGMDQLKRDLQQYIRIDSVLRDRNIGPLAHYLEAAQFTTPPFKAKLQSLVSTDRLPPPDLLSRYTDVSKAWNRGDTKAALSALETMKGGAWNDSVMSDLARRQNVVKQFAALQGARGEKGFDERLLAFYGVLDPREDGYFVRAVESDLVANKAKVLKRAEEKVTRAAALWREYQENGAIDAGLRIESGISERFRSQAGLLSRAHDDVVQGVRVHKQLKAAQPAQWDTLQYEIEAEMAQQRSALLGLQG
ncbi:FHA domain-containing protein, partial [Noviherbaspirillum sp.]|uniref:FHA domain-containing protein n=1 Tax=Noviherbaspirillum sp. TaxID=1926288 RepID=UPI002FE08DD7